MEKIADQMSNLQSANNTRLLCLAGAFALGLGIGALAGPVLDGLVLALLFVGGITHITGMILSHRLQNDPLRAFSRLEIILVWSSWIVLGGLLVGVWLQSIAIA